MSWIEKEMNEIFSNWRETKYYIIVLYILRILLNLNFQVNTFWDITKRQLEESKATIKNKERELEDAEERHQVEIKVCYDQ